MKKSSNKRPISERNKTRDLWTFLICIFLPFVFGFIGSAFTMDAVKSAWYEDLKFNLVPPSWIFPVVWNILFFLIGLALFFSWIDADKKTRIKVGFLFGLNFILNTFWSIFFFGFKSIGVALVDLILLWLSILSIMAFSWNRNRKVTWLLLPYFLWVSFAGVLNYGFWIRL